MLPLRRRHPRLGPHRRQDLLPQLSGASGPGGGGAPGRAERPPPLRRLPSPGHAPLSDVSLALAAAGRDRPVLRASARARGPAPRPARFRAASPPAPRPRPARRRGLPAAQRLLRRQRAGPAAGGGLVVSRPSLPSAAAV